MSAPLTTQFGPCDPWPARFPCDVSTVAEDRLEQAVQVATEVVWSLSGRQFGLCTVTLRPCRRDCWDSSWARSFATLPGVGSDLWPLPALIGGQWFNLTCGGCAGSCSCSAVSEAVLPAPVHDVVEVLLDGSPMVTGSYRVDDNRLLVRTDGGQWPTCNDLTKDDSQVGTWSVTARFGVDVPEGGAWAVGELACQLIKAFNGEDCVIPANVVQLIRQGATIQFPSATDLLKEGLTNLYLVNLFIKTWNPGGLRRRSKTYSVDDPGPRRAGT